MANAELPEAYINHTINQFERNVALGRVQAALRRAVILLFSSYSLDSATCELVSNEFRGRGASE